MRLGEFARASDSAEVIAIIATGCVMGPIALFDKSFIEMLNIDGAAIYDCLYSSVICPIFYTEVLADLSKEPPGQRSAERIVGDVAKKTPIMHSTPNVLHTTICMSELAGNRAS
jgi:hypothetical protein